MNLQIFIAAIFVLSSLSSAAGYNVLCVFPVPSNSHDILGKGIINALLKAGHKVTWMTAYPDKKPSNNLTIIDASETHDIKKDLAMGEMGAMDISSIHTFTRNITWFTVRNKHLRECLAYNNYDAVVTQWFFSDALAGLAVTQQVPWIILSSVPMHASLEYLLDEVRSLPILPMMISDHPVPMNFYQRLMNSFIFIVIYLLTWFQRPDTIFMYEQFNELAAVRGVTLPPFEDALHNISILLLNSHPSFTTSQSLPPNAVEIGGFHIDDDISPLPKDLQNLLDFSANGVIYFSMGSILKSATFPKHTKKHLIKIFGELPYTVLWKYEEKLEDLPKNVHIRDWLPQASVLAHPNIKLFITHGGLLSTIEAIHFGVPVLAVPVFGDQPANANRAVREGYAVKVTYSPDMGIEFDAALKEMLGNNSYFKRAKYLSNLYHDRPVAPSKLVTHYIELAIKSKGAHHLRSKAPLYAWYQRWMLDQILFILTALYILYKTIKYVIKMFIGCMKNTNYNNKKIKKN